MEKDHHQKRGEEAIFFSLSLSPLLTVSHSRREGEEEEEEEEEHIVQRREKFANAQGRDKKIIDGGFVTFMEARQLGKTIVWVVVPFS